MNDGTLWSPGFFAVAAARLGAWADSEEAPKAARKPVATASRFGSLIAKNVFGIELPKTTKIGRRLRIAHQGAIVIHPQASLGDDCILRQGVTIGAGGGDPLRANDAPHVGNRVSLGAGCCLVGRIRVGDDAVIGPNATVMTNIPAQAMVVAQPPRVVRARKPAAEAAQPVVETTQPVAETAPHVVQTAQPVAEGAESAGEAR